MPAALFFVLEMRYANDHNHGERERERDRTRTQYEYPTDGLRGRRNAR